MTSIKAVTGGLPKASGHDIIEVGGMALVGAVVEAASAPYLGDATPVSAVSKVGAAYVVERFGKGLPGGRILAGGLVFAGVMDIVQSMGLMEMAAGLGGKVGGVGKGQAEADGW